MNPWKKLNTEKGENKIEMTIRELGVTEVAIWDLVHWLRDNCIYQSVRKKGSKNFKTDVRC